jgi:hypothetical protein
MGVHLIGVYLMACISCVYLIGVYRISVHLMGIHLISVHLTGVHLMGVYLTGVYIINVCLTSVYLMGIPHKRASHGYVPHKCASHGHASHGCAPHGRVPHKRAPSQACISRACTSFTSLPCAQDTGGENPCIDTKDVLKLLIVGDSAVRPLVTLGARSACEKLPKRLPIGRRRPKMEVG